MNSSARSGKTSHSMLWTLACIAAAAVILGAYIVLGPEPTDFAGGKHVTLSGYREQDPTGVPAELKSASLIERGEYLTHAADCVACHTAEHGTPFVGGRAFVLPFGTLYSTNITPDVETGIGRYTDGDFLDAMHKGIGRGNTRLYPAMPYASYTYMSDADALAIKAYLFTLKPVQSPALPNTLAFPFNQRNLMSVWSVLFNPDTRYKPNIERNAQWNRGAYLVEAMEHCGECHTREMFYLR
jgi:mono/diheme cytochrome c family protein